MTMNTQTNVCCTKQNQLVPHIYKKTRTQRILQGSNQWDSDQLSVHSSVQYFCVYMQTYEQSEWVIHIAGRLLANDSTLLSLLDHNPFQGREAPR